MYLDTGFLEELKKAIKEEIIRSGAIPQTLKTIRALVSVTFDELKKQVAPKGHFAVLALDALKLAVNAFIKRIEDAFLAGDLPLLTELLDEEASTLPA